MPSPWDTCPAPLRSAGALVPWRNTPQGTVYRPDLHGTGFFISRNGLFLSASHVFDFPEGEKTVDICLLHASVGLISMRVVHVVRHPTHDLALGVAVGEPEHHAFINPMTLATTALPVGAEVAVLGYPQTETRTKVEDGIVLTKLRFSPDFYEGRVEMHHDGRLSLAPAGPVYLTNIVAKHRPSDLGGASGGPLVSCETGHVHGVFCSGTAGSAEVSGYAIFTDIITALEWDVAILEDGQRESPMTLRGLAAISDLKLA